MNWLVTALSLLAATSAAAQTAPSTDDSLPCDAFQSHPDGSWSSVRPVRLGAISMSAGVTFTAGVSLNGVDLAHDLSVRCPH